MATTMPIRDAVAIPRASRETALRPARTAAPVVDEQAVSTPERSHKESLVGLAASLVVHFCLLAAMAYIVFDMQDDKTSALSGILGDPENELSDFLPDAGATFEAGGTKQTEELFNQSSTAFSDVNSLMAQRSILGGDGEGDGAGDGEGSGAGIKVGLPAVNVPAYAVTKGSFSAWTEPKDPEPGRNYQIIIQVRLPEKFIKNGRYKIGDVTGMVVGTDGYELPIKFNSSKTIRPQDGVINLIVKGRGGRPTPATASVHDNGVLQLTIEIPGAAQLVRDSIEIQSRLLKEKQTLEIVF